MFFLFFDNPRTLFKKRKNSEKKLEKSPKNEIIKSFGNVTFLALPP